MAEFLTAFPKHILTPQPQVHAQVNNIAVKRKHPAVINQNSLKFRPGAKVNNPLCTLLHTHLHQRVSELKKGKQKHEQR